MNNPLHAAPVVTLLTDFGLRDPYVAEVKAVLLAGGVPPGRFIDLSHDIAAGDIAAATWLLARVWPRFPAGTVHLAVVDPGVGTDRPAVAARAGGQLFVAPGNGLLGFLTDRADLEVVVLDPPATPVSTTFHGRDIFAPAAARLACGAALADLGRGAAGAALGGGLVRGIGQIVWVDHFGNLITDIPRGGAVGSRLEVSGHVIEGPLACYASAPPSTLFWYWGSGGTLEIAVRGESAADHLGGVRPPLAVRLAGP